MLSASCWYVRQASFFIGERLESRPLASIASKPGADARLVSFAATVEAIRSFGIDELGLKPTSNYTRYVVLDRDYVADVVQACDSLSFKRHYWKYPVLGNLPYKGFYQRADAEAEAARMKTAGLDVIIRNVDAFSSLGFFSDPLYSFMLGYPEWQLAELILHELAHATLFIKGEEQFNEEFATWIGRHGAVQYLRYRYGASSPGELAMAGARSDAERFSTFLAETARQLEIIYADPTLDAAEKTSRKAAVLSRRAEEYRLTAVHLFAADGYRNFDMTGINNAFLDLYRLYEEDLSLYDAWHEAMAGGSIRTFISTLVVLDGQRRREPALRGVSMKDAMKSSMR